MPNTVRICGVDYPDCCIVDREKDWGIQTPRKIFRLSFVCDQDGQQLDPLPDVLPREIRRVTPAELDAQPDDEHASVAMTLAMGLAGYTEPGLRDAWPKVESITHVLIYNRKKSPHFIYLDDMDEEDRQQNADVREILEKKKRQEREWHQAGGRATSKWHGYWREAAALARVMRQAKKNFIRDKGTKRGANKWAYQRGKAWWKSEEGFKGTPLESFLDKKNISDSNLLRLTKADIRKKRKKQKFKS